ncbi:MAG TPA: PEP/pyruvate-binding domain-containing protein [Candidatus Eisenbacteria bacterium]|nr:PEP/pyruvate-binding domain-containing protein [Candidatus Eisenbacteria bacterium]
MQGPGLDLTDSRHPAFDRRFFESREDFTVIGGGLLGGKALGLARVKRELELAWRAEEHPDFEVGIPRLTVLATDAFDRFMEENALGALVETAPGDDVVARAFQSANLPAEIVGDLRGLIERVRQPLAVRSSSVLEDAVDRPFAGVYGTKMIPNNQHDAESRFRRLTEAIKFVYASTFFQAARDYRAATGDTAEEKMAVVIQEIVGRRHDHRFYPDLSGVARSWNFYATGHARPEDGAATLALGLGKTIVDGGVAWSYSPAYPRANPPVASPRDLLRETQTRFWAVNMGKPPDYDPLAETEYLLHDGLPEAEEDGVLRWIASTYDPASDRLSPGTGATGPRAVTFAPLLLLEELALNDAIRAMLALGERSHGGPVEIEFAVTIGDRPDRAARIGFLQARSLLVGEEIVDVEPESLRLPDVVAASESVLGNARVEDLVDVVYVRPDRFDPSRSRRIAEEIGAMNRDLAAEGRRYLLIGFGRWGSSDPWLGLPVRWDQISGARVIVEASLPRALAEPSQGSHFFHNLMSFGVSYFTIRHTGPYAIDWAWLEAQPAAAESDFVRRIRLASPLHVEVDGRSGRGAIRRRDTITPKGALS